MRAPAWIGSEDLRRLLTPEAARLLLERALLAGWDPAGDLPRSIQATPDGQLIIMPSATATAAGVKVLGSAPDNPAQGLERIQGIYVLMDGRTLTPSVLLDGAALTALRTPAVSALAIDKLATADADAAVIIGTGAQAIAHAEALLAVRHLKRLVIAGRDRGRTEAAVGQARRFARSASNSAVEITGVIEPAELETPVRTSQIIACCTSAAEPVLEGTWVPDGAVVVAVGSHDPDRRELDSTLMGRSRVVVEDVATALREAGDVVLAIADGALAPSDLTDVADLVHGRITRATDRPNVFKTVGMSWEDLVIAEGAARATAAQEHATDRS